MAVAAYVDRAAAGHLHAGVADLEVHEGRTALSTDIDGAAGLHRHGAVHDRETIDHGIRPFAPVEDQRSSAQATIDHCLRHDLRIVGIGADQTDLLARQVDRTIVDARRDDQRIAVAGPVDGLLDGVAAAGDGQLLRQAEPDAQNLIRVHDHPELGPHREQRIIHVVPAHDRITLVGQGLQRNRRALQIRALVGQRRAVYPPVVRVRHDRYVQLIDRHAPGIVVPHVHQAGVEDAVDARRPVGQTDRVGRRAAGIDRRAVLRLAACRLAEIVAVDKQRIDLDHLAVPLRVPTVIGVGIRRFPAVDHTAFAQPDRGPARTHHCGPEVHARLGDRNLDVSHRVTRADQQGLDLGRGQEPADLLLRGALNGRDAARHERRGRRGSIEERIVVPQRSTGGTDDIRRINRVRGRQHVEIVGGVGVDRHDIGRVIHGADRDHIGHVRGRGDAQAGDVLVARGRQDRDAHAGRHLRHGRQRGRCGVADIRIGRPGSAAQTVAHDQQRMLRIVVAMRDAPVPGRQDVVVKEGSQIAGRCLEGIELRVVGHAADVITDGTEAAGRDACAGGSVIVTGHGVRVVIAGVVAADHFRVGERPAARPAGAAQTRVRVVDTGVDDGDGHAFAAVDVAHLARVAQRQGLAHHRPERPDRLDRADYRVLRQVFEA